MLKRLEEMPPDEYEKVVQDDQKKDKPESGP